MENKTSTDDSLNVKHIFFSLLKFRMITFSLIFFKVYFNNYEYVQDASMGNISQYLSSNLQNVYNMPTRFLSVQRCRQALYYKICGFAVWPYLHLTVTYIPIACTRHSGQPKKGELSSVNR